MPATQKNRLIGVTTELGEDKLLIEQCTLREQLSRLFQIQMEVASDDLAIDFEKIIGTNATVRLQLPGDKTRYFNGYVSRFEQLEHRKEYARYRATLVPWLWFLTRTADCRIFQKKTVPDIIEEVFKAHGFKDYKLKLSETHREWEYCAQYRETDFNFVSRLMEQEGIHYFFVHEDGAHKMILADSASAHEACVNYEKLTYRPRTHEGEETEETVTHWTVQKEIQPGAYSIADFNMKLPAAPIVASSNIDRPHESASFEIYDYPGEFEQQNEADAYAKIRIEELQSQHELISGEATVRGIVPGCVFTLQNHPRDDQNQKYLATGITLRVKTNPYESGADSAGEEFFSCAFTALPADEPFRPARTTPKPAVQGPQTAFVVGKKGEEIDVDEFGRVKVQFHWDRYGTVDENSSCWIRVSQAWAGKNWGAMSIPRIGQEVIVEFLEGDPDRPVITGRLYNAANKVPYDLPANKTISTLKTNSSKGGGGFNEIRFEDKKGEEQIFIHGEKNFDLRIKNDAFEFVGNNQHSIVETDRKEHIKNNRSELVDADHIEKIGKDRHLKVVGKEAKAVDGSLSLSVKGDVVEVFKANHSEQTTADYFLKADNVVIEAMTNITLKVGGSHIVLEAGGIAIKTSGKMEIDAGATLDVVAKAPLKLESSATADLKSSATTVKGDGVVTVQGGVVKIN